MLHQCKTAATSILHELWTFHFDTKSSLLVARSRIPFYCNASFLRYLSFVCFTVYHPLFVPYHLILRILFMSWLLFCQTSIIFSIYDFSLLLRYYKTSIILTIVLTFYQCSSLQDILVAIGAPNLMSFSCELLEHVTIVCFEADHNDPRLRLLVDDLQNQAPQCTVSIDLY